MVHFEEKAHYDLQDLRQIVHLLRAPGGCPWDAAQTHASLRRQMLEEAWEVVDAIDREDAAALRNQIAVKAGALGDPDVQRMLTGINALMDRAIGNDPQVQGDRLRVRLDMALLRYDELSHAVGDMLLCCKEYLGQEDAVRTAALPAFLTSLSQHVSQTENALAK